VGAVRSAEPLDVFARTAGVRDGGVRELLLALAQDLSLATAEAVTLRRLTDDGRWLVPLVSYHPDRGLQAAMAASASAVTPAADSGLWSPVLRDRRPVRWHLPGGSVPTEAVRAQAEHLRRYEVRAVLLAPLHAPDVGLVGGVGLHRYGRDAPFTDADEALLVQFAAQVAGLAALVAASLSGSGGGDPTEGASPP